MEYNIQGKVSFNINFDVEANSEKEAFELAIEELRDYYHLNVINAQHDINSIKYDLDICEYED